MIMNIQDCADNYIMKMFFPISFKKEFEMKHNVVIFVSLLVLCFVCLPLSAQPNVNSIETILIDDFDVADAVDWTWGIRASNGIYVNRDLGEIYPKMGTTPGIPNSLVTYREEDDPEALVLGVQTKYNRKGNNWFEVYPQMTDTASGEVVPYEVPLKGHVTHFDFWVWGANYMYYIDLLVRDADGAVHVIKAGNLAFSGWKNLVIKVPTWMRQRSRLRSGPETLTFLGFRVRTDKEEYVDDFRVFFDQIRYASYTLSDIYDGYYLSDVEFGSPVNNATGGSN